MMKPGEGIKASVKGHEALAGNQRLLDEYSVELSQAQLARLKFGAARAKLSFLSYSTESRLASYHFQTRYDLRARL